MLPRLKITGPKSKVENSWEIPRADRTIRQKAILCVALNFSVPKGEIITRRKILK